MTTQKNTPKVSKPTNPDAKPASQRKPKPRPFADVINYGDLLRPIDDRFMLIR